MIALAAPVAGRRAPVLAWLGCIAAALAVLLLPFAGLGVSAPTLATTGAGALLFVALPGAALLARSRWMTGHPLTFAAWCVATGLALQPLWLTPLWMAHELELAWLVPLASAAALAASRREIVRYVEARMARHPGGRTFAACVAVAAFVALTACLGVMHPFATNPIELVFATQGSIVRNLMDGWPPMNQLLEGVPLSYNYGAHLALMPLAASGHADLLQLVARVAPFLFLEATVILFLAYGRSVLALRWTPLLAAAVAAFWVVGYGPVNNGYYGSVLPSAAAYVLSQPAALVVFFVALRFLAGAASLPPWRAAAAGAALAFSITALRGQGGPVWVAVVAFACLLPLWRERRLDRALAATLAGSVAGMLVALRIFFTLGGAFSGTSFVHVGTTFGWLAEQHAFPIVERLLRHGVSAWWAGAAGFAVMVLMQSKFLAPAFVYELASLWRTPSGPRLHLVATALAGAAATMLTSAPGGSHFSFMHYAALAMALLGGAGLARLLQPAPTRASRVARNAVLALVALLGIVSAWDLDAQLRNFRTVWLAGAPAYHGIADVEPLLDRIPAGAMVLPLLGTADRVRGIEAEWGMRRGVRFAVYPNLLREYAGWENRLAPAMQRRLAAAASIDQHLREGRLDVGDVAAIAATLSRPQPLYVIAPSVAAADSDARLQRIGATKAYTLYSFQPGGPSAAEPRTS